MTSEEMATATTARGTATSEGMAIATGYTIGGIVCSKRAAAGGRPIVAEHTVAGMVKLEGIVEGVAIAAVGIKEAKVAVISRIAIMVVVVVVGSRFAILEAG